MMACIKLYSLDGNIIHTKWRNKRGGESNYLKEINSDAISQNCLAPLALLKFKGHSSSNKKAIIIGKLS